MQEKGTIPASTLESGPTTHGTVANHESTVSPRQAHVQEAAQVTLEAEHEKSTVDCQHPMSAHQRALVAGHLPGFEQEFKFKLFKNLSPSPMCKLDPMSLEATMPLSRAELSQPSLTTPTLEKCLSLTRPTKGRRSSLHHFLQDKGRRTMLFHPRRAKLNG
jgi:hypothetical protein